MDAGAALGNTDSVPISTERIEFSKRNGNTIVPSMRIEMFSQKKERKKERNSIVNVRKKKSLFKSHSY